MQDLLTSMRTPREPRELDSADPLDGRKGPWVYRDIRALPKTGPKGGETARHTSGLARKADYLDARGTEAIRRIALARHVTESEVIREVVDACLDAQEKS